MTLMSFHYWAQVCLRQGKLDQAEKLFLTVASLSPAAARRAAATGLRRAESVHLDPLPLLAAIWARQGRPVEAFERLEQSYGRGTWEEATRQLSPADKQRLQTLAGNCRRREQQLTQLATQRAVPLQVRAELLKQHTEAAHALAEFNLSLARKNPASVGGPPPYSLERIQAALPADAALVAYVSTPRLRWACVVRKHGSPKWLDLAAQAEGGDWSKDDVAPLFEMAAELRQHRRDDWEELCVQLKRQWLQPLEPLLVARDGLPATRTLLLLPSPALRGMPLAVFADHYQVAIVPSATIFAWLRGKPAPASPPRLLLLADPLYAHDRLPATRWEADALARQVEAKLGPGTVKTLLGPEATAARLTPEVAAPNRNAAYRWLHFAMHGEEDTRRSLGTRLRFPTLPPDQPGGPSRRSAISAAEVFESWNLDAALVTMSACETGLGKSALGEGCLGFSQALLLTGARSVLLSQWSVYDGATALLMSRFYENLLGGRPGVPAMSKVAALHEAQSWLRTLTAAEARKLTAGLDIAMLKTAAPDSRPFAHPYYWAGFVLTGDPD